MWLDQRVPFGGEETSPGRGDRVTRDPITQNINTI